MSKKHSKSYTKEVAVRATKAYFTTGDKEELQNLIDISTGILVNLVSKYNLPADVVEEAKVNMLVDFLDNLKRYDAEKSDNYVMFSYVLILSNVHRAWYEYKYPHMSARRTYSVRCTKLIAEGDEEAIQEEINNHKYISQALVDRTRAEMKYIHVTENAPDEWENKSGYLDLNEQLTYDEPELNELLDALTVHDSLIEHINRLPDMQRTIIMELFFNKRTLRDISADLGVSHETVRTHRTQAFNTLRVKMTYDGAMKDLNVDDINLDILLDLTET